MSFIKSRERVLPVNCFRKGEAEGGCGVIGVACESKIAGRHLLPALCQMKNRGNGKGGGIAAVGLSAEALGVTQQILDNCYLLALAYLDHNSQQEVERESIHPIFEISHTLCMPHLISFDGMRPPEVVIYFVRVKKSHIETFQETNQLKQLSEQAAEDEIVYQNSYRLNRLFYAAEGSKKAFVLSHGKNLLVLKLVGFGEDVIQYYQLEDFKAHVWIGHHRYPTKGRVWHPGGAHPFVGLNEALVHNGDFANYHSISEYLLQRRIHPLFLTDTEVSVLLFDLLHRTYKYPLEYVIEALAPTTERDFSLLPEEKKPIYQLLQQSHIHASPDGPWFFLIAQSTVQANKPAYRLIGITDTSMLRPQVFALQRGPMPIGLAASEKQAIDAVLKSLSQESSEFWDCADDYWYARGGSHIDGGTFYFTVQPDEKDKGVLKCSDKFGRVVHERILKPPYAGSHQAESFAFPDIPSKELVEWAAGNVLDKSYEVLIDFLEALRKSATTDVGRERALKVITVLLDWSFPLKHLRRSSYRSILNQSLTELLSDVVQNPSDLYAGLDFEGTCPQPKIQGQTLVINARGYPAEGERSLALEIVEMYKRGFKKLIVFNCLGHRFIANGLGPNSHGLQIDIYGSSGDYLASGIDGAIVHVHGSSQDQVAQIMKSGTLVIHGDVGQTFMYGAKGGSVFIRGNAAGRPLINAVGKPRVVINGTCLDYLMESFMAGDPLKGGGFAVVNGVAFDEDGQIIDMETPYPGNNLFSLASGGAVYLRDPSGKVVEEQLNGGRFAEVTEQDWALLCPYLEENERYFGIPLQRLLTDGECTKSFYQIYRKIIPSRVRALHQEEAWVKMRDEG